MTSCGDFTKNSTFDWKLVKRYVGKREGLEQTSSFTVAMIVVGVRQSESAECWLRPD